MKYLWIVYVHCTVHTALTVHGRCAFCILFGVLKGAEYSLHSSRTFYSFIYEEKDMCVCRWQIQPATAAAPETKWFHFSNNNTESEMS